MTEQMDIFNDTQPKTNAHKKQDNIASKDDEAKPKRTEDKQEHKDTNESVVHSQGPSHDYSNATKDSSDTNEDTNTHEYKKMHTYEVTHTKQTLHALAERLTSRFLWVTNDIVPESASQIIHVDYHLDYDTIQSLYDQERIITYYTEHTYTTWINKSVTKQKKSKRRKK